MMIEIFSLVISIIALLISIGGIIYTRIQTNLDKGSMEIQIHSLISEAERKMIELVDNDNEAQRKASYKAAKFAYLNAFEEACAKYIDKKVDRTRFKKNYIDAISGLISSEPYKKYIEPIDSKYRCIKKVYNEWHNLEK